MKESFVIGSRGSRLALIQAEWVRTHLTRFNPTFKITIDVVKTSGDVNAQPLSVIGGKGVFTRELEKALIDQRIDLAVHSLKDLPTILPERLALSAICEREDPRDVLVLPNHSVTSALSVDGLAHGAVVGTSSPRRLAQLKHQRPDLEIKELRGNVDTRLRKLDEGNYDALILAAAGLRRLGLAHRISAAIEPETMLPAVGQGALGIETRAGDERTIALVRVLNHEATYFACLAERAMLRALGGGCLLPIAGHAVVTGAELRLAGLVAAVDGGRVIGETISGSSVAAERLGNELGERILNAGGLQLLASRL